MIILIDRAIEKTIYVRNLMNDLKGDLSISNNRRGYIFSASNKNKRIFFLLNLKFKITQNRKKKLLF